MKSIKKISFFLLIFIFSLFFSSSTIQATETTDLAIGSSCPILTPSICATDKCEISSAGSSFCVCNTGQHCKEKYGQTAPDEVWTCNPGNEQSLGLSFCDSNKREAQMPVTPEQAASGAGTTSTTPTSESTESEEITLTAPKTNIPIPGLDQFTDIKVTPGESVSIPYMAQYIVGIYKYGLVIAAILATMMLMIGGIMYMTAAAMPDRISTAKNIIFGAISGLILLLGSYLMLVLINPNLVRLEAIDISTIKADVLDGVMPGDNYDWSTTAATAPLDRSLCLDPKTEVKINGNEGRQAMVQAAIAYKESGLVSYAFGGRGQPCNDPPASGIKSVETVCERYSGGHFDCSEGMRNRISRYLSSGRADDIKGPWELEYCTDCSGFINILAKCAADHSVSAGTSRQFGCNGERMRQFHPISKADAKPGDIVGFSNHFTERGAGHVMLCMNNGCTQIIHVHGPQAYTASNANKAIDIDDQEYLDDKLVDLIRNQKNLPSGQTFKMEYRRMTTFDYPGDVQAPLPSCTAVEQYSNCRPRPGDNCQ